MSDQQAVPVFTIKLYKSNDPNAASVVFLAERLEIEKPMQGLVRIIVMKERGPNQSYEIGDGCAYVWAVIENPSGRTTEVIRPRMAQTVLRG